ncbi:hypothetical protein OGM63_19015 [Plectonema radiosum NIES-515]|uniref:Uncharacterized protein n=1 Tax=Plectonema radiosum NIES-515 TaxID=2986073 RepID=A0ABT3B2I1_9CYAN|nr:hypothetical protein [Plectonema radiosum]MCV3215576.1 hypothetical protein [Plectonema radiosum NIES-515]
MSNQKLPLLTSEQSMRGLMPEELMSEGYMEADDFPVYETQKERLQRIEEQQRFAKKQLAEIKEWQEI